MLVYKDSRGFTVGEGVLVMLLVGVIATVGIFVWQRRQDTSNKKDQISVNEYEGPIRLFIEGVNDAEFINTYRLGLVLEDTAVGCAASERVETGIRTSYTDTALQVTLAADIEPINDVGAGCLSLPKPHEDRIDLDKKWLAKGGDKTVTVNGQQHTLHINLANRTLSLDTGELFPYYPDKIALLSTFNCGHETRQELEAYARSKGFTFADAVYPGLDKLYHRPTEELHIEFSPSVKALRAAQDEARTRGDYGEQCRPDVSPPDLSSLKQ